MTEIERENPPESAHDGASGRLTVRIAPELKRQLKAQARVEGRTLAGLVNVVLRRYLASEIDARMEPINLSNNELMAR